MLNNINKNTHIYKYYDSKNNKLIDIVKAFNIGYDKYSFVPHRINNYIININNINLYIMNRFLKNKKLIHKLKTIIKRKKKIKIIKRVFDKKTEIEEQTTNEFIDFFIILISLVVLFIFFYIIYELVENSKEKKKLILNYNK